MLEALFRRHKYAIQTHLLETLKVRGPMPKRHYPCIIESTLFLWAGAKGGVEREGRMGPHREEAEAGD